MGGRGREHTWHYSTAAYLTACDTGQKEFLVRYENKSAARDCILSPSATLENTLGNILILFSVLSAIDRGVVGVDVAGDEGSWPLRRHLPMLVRAEELGVPMTLHAGEWPHPRFTSILENLELALECGARRIGHGVALAHPEAAALRARAAASGTLVEVCMTSNVGSGRVGSFAEHPVRTLLDAGVRCALSSDNLLLSGDAHLVAGATLELARFVDLVGCSEAEVKEVLLAGARASFCPGAAAVAVEMEADIDRVLASANDDGSAAHGLLRTVY